MKKIHLLLFFKIKSTFILFFLIVLSNFGLTQSDLSYSKVYDLKEFLNEFDQKGTWVNHMPYGTWSKNGNDAKYKITFKNAGDKYIIDYIIIRDDTIFRELSTIDYNTLRLDNIMLPLITQDCSILYDSLQVSYPQLNLITKKKYYRLLSAKKTRNKELTDYSILETSGYNLLNKMDKKILERGFEIKDIFILEKKFKKLYALNISYMDKIASYTNCNLSKYKKTKELLRPNDLEDFEIFIDTTVLIKGQLEKGIKNGLWYYKSFCSNDLVKLDKNFCGSLNIEYINDIFSGFLLIRDNNGYGILIGRMKNNLPTGTWMGENNVRYNMN